MEGGGGGGGGGGVSMLETTDNLGNPSWQISQK